MNYLINSAVLLLAAFIGFSSHRASLCTVTREGIDIDALATRLHCGDADSFVMAWDELLACIGDRSATLEKTN